MQVLLQFMEKRILEIMIGIFLEQFRKIEYSSRTLRNMISQGMIMILPFCKIFQVKWPMIFTILQFKISFLKKSLVLNLKKNEPP